MPDLDDVGRIGRDLPGTLVSEGEQFALEVLLNGKRKGYVWTWRERVHPKTARVINDRVLAVRVPNLSAKEMLLAAHPEFLFTEPHYDGYAAVLIRLENVCLRELEELIVEAWRCTKSDV